MEIVNGEALCIFFIALILLLNVLRKDIKNARIRREKERKVLGLGRKEKAKRFRA